MLKCFVFSISTKSVSFKFCINAIITSIFQLVQYRVYRAAMELINMNPTNLHFIHDTTSERAKKEVYGLYGRNNKGYFNSFQDRFFCINMN